MTHMLAPTMWVRRTVSSVSEMRRQMMVWELVSAWVKRKRRMRVMAPSVKAERPIQTMATTWEGMEMGRDSRSERGTKGSGVSVSE